MKNIVAVDLDSTLHEYMHTVALVALNEFGVRLEGSPRDWEDVFPEEFSRDRHVEVYQRCHDREYIFLTNPYPGAPKALKEISNMGYDVRYYTDRKESAHSDTEDWLEKHGFPNIGGLNCCRDKRGDLLQIKDELATVIDDRPRTMIFARYELGLDHVFSLRHGYNQNFSDIPGIHLFNTWTEILDKFKEIM